MCAVVLLDSSRCRILQAMGKGKMAPLMQHRWVTKASFPGCVKAKQGWQPTLAPVASERLVAAWNMEDGQAEGKSFFLTLTTMESLKWFIVGKVEALGRKVLVLERAWVFVFVDDSAKARLHRTSACWCSLLHPLCST